MISIVHATIKEAAKTLERVVYFKSSNQRGVHDKLRKEVN